MKTKEPEVTEKKQFKWEILDPDYRAIKVGCHGLPKNVEKPMVKIFMVVCERIEDEEK